jgi:hypothetical protein
MHRFWSRLSAIAVAIFASGCASSMATVTVYQPLSSLQKPTALHVSESNFAGQRMLIRCVPSTDGKYHKPADAQRLCVKLSSLFTNQGAQVDIAVPQRGGGAVPELVNGARPDLIVEVTTRLLHEKNPAFLWAACVLSCSVIPAYHEQSIAQDISIRDADGFELASDSLQARFVEYQGGGIWVVNKALDLTVREEPEHLTGNAAGKEFSRDFYRQVNQLAFNARVRAAVLRSFDTPPAGTKKLGGAPSP